MAKAFVLGGSICVIGQGIMNYCKSLGLDEESAGTWTAIFLVLGSVILTGFNVYQKLATWGGAGALVPITGFANSVASPAIDSHSEGLVLGGGAKIFTVAGPVLLYGTLSGAIYGVLYWLVTAFVK